MEILIILFVTVMVLFAGAVGHNMGYKKREEEFQKNPIIFTIGKENALHVDNKGAKTKVTIYNKNLVEFIK